MSEQELLKVVKEAKIGRRNAKAALTRAGKTLRHALQGQRPSEEVKESLTKLQEAYEKLIIKHEEYTKLIEDDAEFEKEEDWLADCQEAFMSFKIEGKLHLDKATKQAIEESTTNSQSSVNASDEQNENNSEQNEINNVIVDVEQDTKTAPRLSRLMSRPEVNLMPRGERYPRKTARADLRWKNRNCLNFLEMYGNTRYLKPILSTLLSPGTLNGTL